MYYRYMEPSIKLKVLALSDQMKPRIDLLDVENQNTLLRAIWMHHGADIKASTILRAAQQLRKN
jgi:hypothetical protein